MLLLASAFLYASMAVAARMLAGQLPASMLTSARYALGVAVVAALFVLDGKRPNFSRPYLLLARGVFGAAATYTYFVAIERAGVGTATVLNTLYPLYATLFAIPFLNERPTARGFWGLGVATVGTVCVCVGSAPELKALSWSNIGVISGLVSGLLAGISVTVIRALRSDTDAKTVFLAFSGVGLVAVGPLAAAQWVNPSGQAWLILLFMAALSVAAQMLFTYALGHYPTAQAAVGMQAVPVFSFVLAYALLGEVPTQLTTLGAALCVAGVLLGSTPKPGNV